MLDLDTFEANVKRNTTVTTAKIPIDNIFICSGSYCSILLLSVR